MCHKNIFELKEKVYLNCLVCLILFIYFISVRETCVYKCEVMCELCDETTKEELEFWFLENYLKQSQRSLTKLRKAWK